MESKGFKLFRNYAGFRQDKAVQEEAVGAQSILRFLRGKAPTAEEAAEAGAAAKALHDEQGGGDVFTEDPFFSGLRIFGVS